MSLAYNGFTIDYTVVASPYRICIYYGGVYGYIQNGSRRYYTNTGSKTYYIDAGFSPLNYLDDYAPNDCTPCASYYAGYPCVYSYYNDECGRWTVTVTNNSTSTLFYRFDTNGTYGTAYICGTFTTKSKTFYGDNNGPGCYPPIGGSFIQIEEYTGSGQFCDDYCDGYYYDPISETCYSI